MPKLYWTPASCSAASFIACTIAKLDWDCEYTDISTHKTESGTDFYTINPLGNVPALTFDDGTLLNEGAAVLFYIADQAPAGLLAPAPGTMERYVCINAMNYVGTEIHKGN